MKPYVNIDRILTDCDAPGSSQQHRPWSLRALHPGRGAGVARLQRALLSWLGPRLEIQLALIQGAVVVMLRGQNK